jgi:3-oxoadipate enol-lactonase
MSADVVRRSLMVRGQRVSYLTLDAEVAGPVALLVHGSGVSARYWVEQLRGLAPAARAVALDLPGHGQSDDALEPGLEHYVEVVRGFVETLGVGPVIAVGHSLGGTVALALAARCPAAVRGLVLLSACARLPRTEAPAQWLLPFLPGPLRKVVFFMTAKRLLFGPGAPAGATRLGLQELRACHPRTLARDLAIARAMDLRDAARELRVPTLILCGSRDQVTPPELSRELHALVAKSRLVVIEGAGHMLLMETPVIVNREIAAFAEALTTTARASRARLATVCRPALSPPRWLVARLRALLATYGPWRTQAS